MKGTWEAPRIMVQEFEANEYVAACGDSGKVYNFKCDAGVGVTHGAGLLKTKYVWDVTTDDGRKLTSLGGYYGPCGETHQAESDDEFIYGYMDDVYTNQNENIRVVIWTDHGTNVHCTTNLDINSWETAKS